MKTIIIELTEEQEKTLLTDMINIEDWILNALNEKIRRTADIIIEKNTDKSPQKITIEDKLTIISNLNLKTAEEMNLELKNSL